MARRQNTSEPPKQYKRVITFAELTGIAGEKVALRLCQHFAGLKIPSPTQVLRAKRNAALVREWEAGASIAELVVKFNMSRDAVFATLKKYVQARDAGMLATKEDFINDDKQR